MCGLSFTVLNLESTLKSRDLNVRAGGMSQQLEVLAEDPTLNLGTHRGSQLIVLPLPGDLMPSSGLSGHPHIYVPQHIKIIQDEINH